MEEELAVLLVSFDFLLMEELSLLVFHFEFDVVELYLKIWNRAD